MCMSIKEAQFSKTLVYAARCKDGEHLLGYQNMAENLSDENVNAMMLPIPAAKPLTQDNMINTEKAPNLLKDMEKFFRRPLLSISKGAILSFASDSRSFEIFKSGMYTVIRSESFSALKLAVKKLPPDLQISISNEVLAAYTKWYPKWQVFLCLWTGREKIEAHPILCKFESMYPDKLFYPGLDEHSGSVPRLDKKVERDHTLLIGHHERGNEVEFTDKIVDSWYHIPRKVMGERPDWQTKNGDWWVDLNKVNKSKQNEHSEEWTGLDFELQFPPDA